MSTLTRSTPPRPPATPARPAARLPRTAVPAGLRLLEVVRGLLAAVLLLAVAVGVPTALVHLVGNPLPTTAPTRGWLDAELTAGAVIDVLAVVLWAVWAHFLVCVVAEFATWNRGGAAGRLPFAGANQVLAQRLVAAVLLLAAGGVFVPSAPTTVPVAAAVLVAADADALPGGVRVTSPAAAALPEAGWTAPAPSAAPATVTYVVAPPQGRHHDCLWDIAERTLGDPLRYREVFELNRDRVQPDGSRLVDADLIRPGWVLLLPADAVGATTTPLTAPPVATPPVPTPPVSTPPVSTPPASPTPTAADSAATDAPAAGWAAAPAEPTLDHPASVAAPTDDDRPAGSRTPAALGGGLVTAGVLVALSRRVRSGAAVVDRLQRSADPDGVRFLRAALQGLAAACAADGTPLPSLVAAHLSADELVLHPDPGATGAAAVPPAPWTVLPGGAWRLARVDLPAVDGTGDATVPYPLLVDVAADGAHALLLDLESAPGPVSVGGPAESARAVVTALAVGIATSAWSSGTDVHLVGFGDELAALAPGVLHAHPRLADVLPGLGVQRTTWSPDARSTRPSRSVVVLSGPPAPDELRRLQVLTTGGRTPVAVVCVGDLPGAGWRFHVDAEGVLDLGVLGLRGTARRLPPAEYAPWLAALRAAV